MSEYQIVEQIPDWEAYNLLRSLVGWSVMDKIPTKKGLSCGLYSLCIFDQETLIGCGRVIGDEGLYFYIQDIIIHPDYQKKGLGKALMEKIMDYIHTHAQKNAFVGLMAASGVSDFYIRYGFQKRPEEGPGMYYLIS